MKKKGYRGTRCEKRYLSKCADGVVKTFTIIESKYADKLQEDENIKEFRCNVPLDNLEIGEYTSDFVATKVNGELMVRECMFRNQMKPKTARLLDISRNYWRRRGVEDWGIVIEKKKEETDAEE